MRKQQTCACYAFEHTNDNVIQPYYLYTNYHTCRTNNRQKFPVVPNFADNALETMHLRIRA